MSHIGSIVATSGAIFIVVSLTLVRYRYIDGNSHRFAILQIIGAALLGASVIWQFNIGTLLLESYCVLINAHTIIRNRKQARETPTASSAT